MNKFLVTGRGIHRRTLKLYPNRCSSSSLPCPRANANEETELEGNAISRRGLAAMEWVVHVGRGKDGAMFRNEYCDKVRSRGASPGRMFRRGRRSRRHPCYGRASVAAQRIRLGSRPRMKNTEGDRRQEFRVPTRLHCVCLELCRTFVAIVVR